MIKNSVIIIREQDNVITGCCVPFEGDIIKEVANTDVFLNLVDERNITGDIYNNLMKEYGDSIILDVIDSRNYAYMLPRLIKDVIKYRVPLLQSLKTLFALKVPAVICNGRIIINGKEELNINSLEKITKILKH